MNYQFGSTEHLQAMAEKAQKQLDRQLELQYLERQAIASENANSKADKANEIAEQALQEARKSRIISTISTAISIVSVLAAIASIVISLICQ